MSYAWVKVEVDLEKTKELIKSCAPTFAKRVAPLYDALGWTWVVREHGKTVEKVPSAEEIYSAILMALDDFPEGEEVPQKYTTFSGGLVVGYQVLEDVTAPILKFVYEYPFEEV